ncbi:MAG: hypothetical protein QOJ41_2199, partial [Acidobacteriaceae bacterium]|nr:hypothetical protein [Acidobacteriaceae bacterium]
MDPDPPAVSADLTTSRFAELIACHDSEINRHQGLLIKDAEGKLVGTVTRGDVLRASDQDPSEAMTALEAGSRKLVVTYSDEILHEASARMLRNNIGRVPVVDR